MMNYQKIRSLIEENSDIVNFSEFGEGVQKSWIDKAQNILGLAFPPSYIWWLENFKGGDIDGDEVFSVYEREFSTFKGGDIIYMYDPNRTGSLLSLGRLYILINDFGEGYYFALDQMGERGEYPIFEKKSNTRFSNTFSRIPGKTAFGLIPKYSRDNLKEKVHRDSFFH